MARLLKHGISGALKRKSKLCDVCKMTRRALAVLRPCTIAA